MSKKELSILQVHEENEYLLSIEIFKNWTKTMLMSLSNNSYKFKYKKG
jgi:hypothetical protein